MDGRKEETSFSVNCFVRTKRDVLSSLDSCQDHNLNEYIIKFEIVFLENSFVIFSL